ncbi:hypothetical protein J6500_09160 [Bradyrhizobium sp. WSM 1704]|uniref:hypothetical protein n=1 Tax=Bradyrhizobium semiaridum TaxID=2821404 RepID=UPI001CE37046|nr:hypothetical protein [Bradyrhizobium semiaridum]MCA6122064.1 hypothetical protein [Bradyrhizobium semiaridum]
MAIHACSELGGPAEAETAYLESLIRQDFERCHPGETLDDLKRRASFSKEDRGLLRDWMAVAASRAAAERARRSDLNSAGPFALAHQALPASPASTAFSMADTHRTACT